MLLQLHIYLLYEMSSMCVCVHMCENVYGYENIFVKKFIAFKKENGHRSQLIRNYYVLNLKILQLASSDLHKRGYSWES